MIDYEMLSWVIMFLPLLGIVWAPKTWIAGELVTASNMNIQVRDHLNDLRDDLDKSPSQINLLGDPSFLIWPKGDTSDPAYWKSSGTGATVERCGTGLTDTKRKVGDFCCELAYGSATAYLAQDLLPTADYDDGFDGEDFSCGAWVWSDSTDARIGFDDGSSPDYSDAHSGTSVWEWLTFSYVVSGSATKLAFQHKLNASGSLYTSWPTVVKGPIAPEKPAWPRVLRPEFGPIFTGDPLGTGTNLWNGGFSRPFRVENVWIVCLSNVATTALIFDVNQYDSAAWTSMFSTKPQVAVGKARSVNAVPDGTYKYRCFTGAFGADVTDYGEINIDCDQAATTGGKNPWVAIRCLSFMRPQELLLSHNSIGV